MNSVLAKRFSYRILCEFSFFFPAVISISDIRLRPASLIQPYNLATWTPKPQDWPLPLFLCVEDNTEVVHRGGYDCTLPDHARITTFPAVAPQKSRHPHPRSVHLQSNRYKIVAFHRYKSYTSSCINDYCGLRTHDYLSYAPIPRLGRITRREVKWVKKIYQFSWRLPLTIYTSRVPVYSLASSPNPPCIGFQEPLPFRCAHIYLSIPSDTIPTPQFRPADISRSRRNTSYSELNTFVLVSPTQIKHSMEVFRIRTGYPCPAFSLKLPPFERTTIFEGYLQEASRTCTPGM